MWIYGAIGFVIGFILGMIVNARLLRGVPKAQITSDKSLRLRFGLLNWGIALLGLAIGTALY